MDAQNATDAPSAIQSFYDLHKNYLNSEQFYPIWKSEADDAPWEEIEKTVDAAEAAWCKFRCATISKFFEAKGHIMEGDLSKDQMTSYCCGVAGRESHGCPPLRTLI
jgi:hypothetical protein